MEKTCFQHPDSLAIAPCRVCEKLLCTRCATPVGKEVFCSPRCADVFNEVKDWIEPKPKTDKWDPSAEGTPAAAQLPEDDSALELEAATGSAEPPAGAILADDSISVSQLPKDDSALEMGRMPRSEDSPT